MSNSSINNEIRGFTLIEVLVATVILFLFIAMAAQIFQQSATASLKAERAIKVSALVPLVVENIRNQIDNTKSLGSLRGEGQIEEVKYRWQARLTQRKPPITGFDPLTLEFRSYGDKYNLWNVDLTVSMGSYERHWVYEELTWFE